MIIDGKTYQQQYRKCSRDCTHGQDGLGHGPYWYRSAPGKSLHYVGKNLPDEVLHHLDLMKSRRAELKALAAQLRADEDAAHAAANHASALRHALESLISGNAQDANLLKELNLTEFLV